MENLNIPIQVENLIKGLLSKEPDHIRENYRNTLEIIRNEIDRALAKAATRTVSF